MAHAKPFFPGGLKFHVASVKNNDNNEKKIFWMCPWMHGAQHHQPCNNTGHDSTGDTSKDNHSPGSGNRGVSPSPHKRSNHCN